MKRSLSLVLSLFLSLAASSGADTAPPAPPENSPVARHGQLGVEDNRVVDQHGNPVALHGMSLFWSQWMGGFYNRDAVAWLRDDWGCSIIRAAMAVRGGGYLREPERERAKVAAVVEAAVDLGLYVIVDWHAHSADQQTDEAVGFFTWVAESFGHHPNVIYEPWNEPLRHHDWADHIKPYHEKVIAAVRAHDPDNLVVCGSSTWSQDVDVAAADPLDGANIAYTLHFYAGTHRGELREKARAALASGAALFVTEWGTCAADGDGEIDPAETVRWLEFMDEHHLSWCNWAVSDKDEAAAALTPGAATTGGWREDELTESGKLVRQAIRQRATNPQQ